MRNEDIIDLEYEEFISHTCKMKKEELYYLVQFMYGYITSVRDIINNRKKSQRSKSK